MKPYNTSDADTEFFRAYHFPQRSKSNQEQGSGRNDSPWTIAGIFALNYHCHPEQVLDMTLQNITLYNAVIPSFSSGKDDEVIDATDPRNADKIRKLLDI